MAVVVLSNAIGTDVGLYAAKAIEIIAPALTEARKQTETPAPRDSEFDRYVGTYDSVWGRFSVTRWENGLAVVDLDSRNPFEDLPTLKHVDGHLFKRVRSDDESLGEAWQFAVDADGLAVSVTTHSNPSQRVR